MGAHQLHTAREAPVQLHRQAVVKRVADGRPPGDPAGEAVGPQDRVPIDTLERRQREREPVECGLRGRLKIGRQTPLRGHGREPEHLVLNQQVDAACSQVAHLQRVVFTVVYSYRKPRFTVRLGRRRQLSLAYPYSAHWLP